ncbi:zinc ABC transporter substrate-binding protein [Anabaena sp. FACHB-1237]|uniref:metal ABC transporter solute-binding protein, Zn/Mn family n=1 Tax=Anabaena sp. FACHB-1237 TaxID=2692769 RepID=UPI001680E095|nr:zinc ABC transporter substrate-binding protein [Anabaena sp. FACHB-1237]MBD2139560.1 zinc ABC transporter substrate-binding protein [Anabaena sp. FACHB-1237]
MLKKTTFKGILNITIISLILTIVGCNQKNTNNNIYSKSQNLNSNNLPVVVATNSIICDLTKQIAAKTINLICLIPPGINPINYQSVPEDKQAIDQAKLILYHGYNFDPGLTKMIRTTENNIPKIPVAEIAVKSPIKFKKNGQEVPEPHIWHNVKNAMKMVYIINDNLGKTFPKNANLYNENANKINQELSQLNSWVKTRLDSIPNKNRQLLTTNTAMIYYVNAYNLPYKNISKTTDVNIDNVAENIKKSKVPTIFADTTISLNSLTAVSKKANVRLFPRPLYIDGLGEVNSDGETYQKMMDANTRTIVEGLGGTYLKFAVKH